MRILGVDPGSRISGWGLLSGTVNRPLLVDCGIVKLPRTVPFAERLYRLHATFDELVRRLEPTHAAVELPFHGVSARSALQLAHARGVVLASLAGAAIEVAEYTPAAVKKAVTGSGRADKEQVMRIIGHLLALPRDMAPTPDLCDALAVALCDLSRRRLSLALERPVSR